MYYTVFYILYVLYFIYTWLACIMTFIMYIGTVLDRIDYNMEQTIEHAREGVSQLEQAEQTQKSSLGPKCIIALCCVIAILILILWLKHRS